MLYIQRRYEGWIETVSDCETRKIARFELGEYRMSEPDAHFYISTRACKAWRER